MTIRPIIIVYTSDVNDAEPRLSFSVKKKRARAEMFRYRLYIYPYK